MRSLGKVLGDIWRATKGYGSPDVRRAPAVQARLELRDHLPGFHVGSFTYSVGIPSILYQDAAATLTIGRYCSIAQGLTIFLGGEHRTDWVTTYPFNCLWDSAASIPGYPFTKGDVTIGNDVWIGRDVTILSGVNIGDGAVIGCGALVSRDVPPFGIVAGNPARLVRLRFTQSQRERLLRIRWWEWPKSEVERAVPFLLSDDIEGFLTFCRHHEGDMPSCTDRRAMEVRP